MRIKPDHGLRGTWLDASKALVWLLGSFPCRADTIPTVISSAVPPPRTLPPVWSTRHRYETHFSLRVFRSRQHFALPAPRRTGTGGRLGQRLSPCAARPAALPTFPSPL